MVKVNTVKNVLSLCDGMACGRLALPFEPDFYNYVAVEIDKYPRMIADNNYARISRPFNDVYEITREWVLNEAPAFDWVIFGFPCQKFSVSGDQGGLQKDPILFQCMKILVWCTERNPRLKYIIENVKMKKAFKQEVDAVIKAPFCTLINSSLVSAQNRERYYWTNFPVSQPSEKGITLQGILEYADDGWFTDRQKSLCMDASYHKGGNDRHYLEKCRRQLVFKYSSSTRHRKCSDETMKEIERRMIPTEKSLTLMTGKGCTGGVRSCTLVAKTDGESMLYRRLTVRECARLQNIPEHFNFASVSNTQAYKAIGNGWTVDVIKHIFKEGCGR